MPSYKVLAKSFIGNAIREEGEVVDYDGIPADNLEALDAPAEMAAAQAPAAATRSKARQFAAAQTGDPANADALA